MINFVKKTILSLLVAAIGFGIGSRTRPDEPFYPETRETRPVFDFDVRGDWQMVQRLAGVSGLQPPPIFVLEKEDEDSRAYFLPRTYAIYISPSTLKSPPSEIRMTLLHEFSHAVLTFSTNANESEEQHCLMAKLGFFSAFGKLIGDPTGAELYSDFYSSHCP